MNLRNKMLMAAAVTLASSVASLGAAAVPASATGFKDVVLCNHQNPALCMNGYDGNGGPVNGYPYTPGAAQNVDVTALTECGGTVTSTCPFTDTAFDQHFLGKSIISITNRANKMTYRSDSQGLAVIEATGGGDGQVWVQLGDLNGSNLGAVLINVYASDKLGQTEEVCSSGSGGQLFLVEPGSCRWGEQAGN